MLHSEHAVATLAQSRIAVKVGRRQRAVTEPRFFTTRQISPQPLFALLDELGWSPPQRLPPCRRPRRFCGIGQQVLLLAADRGTR